MRLTLVLVVLVAGLAGCSSSGSGAAPVISSSQTPSGTAVAAESTSATAAASPTEPPAATYPPTTIEQAMALAAQGDATVLSLYKSDPRPFGSCARPNFYVVVPSGLQGRVLVEDELAFFAAHGGFEQGGNCPAYLYAFHTATEASGGDGYTAGAIILDGSLEIDADGASTVTINQ